MSDDELVAIIKAASAELDQQPSIYDRGCAAIDDGVRFLDKAAARITALKAELAEVRGVVRFAFDHLTADTFTGDVPSEFYERARAILRPGDGGNG